MRTPDRRCQITRPAHAHAFERHRDTVIVRGLKKKAGLFGIADERMGKRPRAHVPRAIEVSQARGCLPNDVLLHAH